MMQRCFSTQYVGYKLFGISWQQFEQMPGAADATYADEHRYVLQAPGLSVNISTRYSYCVCSWISVFVTGTEPVDEHYMFSATDTWSVDEHQYSLRTPDLQTKMGVCHIHWVFP